MTARQGPSASAPATSGAALTAPLRSDPAVTTGQFDNGLRYYLRANTQPQSRAELRLAVNAGSILEDDDQRGLAHFVEHMAFNGTKHFPKQESSSFLQSIGMRFGADVNAYTSFDETVYMLQVPTDKPEVLDKAMLILEDWAHNVSFDPVEIDKERGVVIEEWRLRRGAGARMQDKQFPVLLKGSRYADRLPIGDDGQHSAVQARAAEEVLHDWYRPDLMAVVAVGDFDVDTIEGLVRKHLRIDSGAPRAEAASGLRRAGAAGHAVTRITTDKEAQGASVSIYVKASPQRPTTVGDYRREITTRLAAAMLSTRLGEAAQRPASPLLGASAARARIVRATDATIVTAALRQEQRRSRSRLALYRSRASHAIRLHAARARAAEDEHAARDGARGGRKGHPGLGAARGRVPSATSPCRSRFRTGRPRAISPAASCPRSRSTRSTPSRRRGCRTPNRVVLLYAPVTAGAALPDAGKLAAMIKNAESATIARTWRAPTRSRCSTSCRRAAQSRRRRRARRSASPNGNCRTARRSC